MHTHSQRPRTCTIGINRKSYSIVNISIANRSSKTRNRNDNVSIKCHHNSIRKSARATSRTLYDTITITCNDMATLIRRSIDTLCRSNKTHRMVHIHFNSMNTRDTGIDRDLNI